jgi:hypothetical protein
LRLVSAVLKFKIIGGLLFTLGGLIFLTREFGPGTTAYNFQKEVREASGTQSSEDLGYVTGHLARGLAVQMTISLMALYSMRKRSPGWLRAMLACAIGWGLRNPDLGLVISCILFLLTLTKSAQEYLKSPSVGAVSRGI